MTRVFRYFMLFVMLFITIGIVSAQESESIRGLHKVKRKETIFGISRMYDLTIEELLNANPEMKEADYELKKGDILKIPFPSNAGKAGQPVQASSANQQQNQPVNNMAPAAPAKGSDDLTKRPIRLGVMLPLHDVNGDGKRMVEYYRGILMACDSLKSLGISVDVYAWNASEDGDIHQIMDLKDAQNCDIIFGPLYSKQMEAMSFFVDRHDIQLVIPFSINAPQLTTNRHIFQVWQSPNDQNEAIVSHFMVKFKDYHPVFIDCNDSTSKKGVYTASLRRQLEQRNISYSLTNLKSGEDSFSKAFSRTKPNVVILNSARSAELSVAFSKINGMQANNPELNITMFGYTEWLMYTRSHLDNFYKFNAYIPSVFYYNPLSAATQRLQQKYRWNFHTDMQNYPQRFALAGFDHAYFFIRGLHKYGKTFNGAAGMFGYPPVQTPLEFERYGNGGLRNKALLFVHYTPEHRVETIKF